MDKIQNTFSKVKKQLGGKKRKQDRTGASTPGESVDSSGSFLRPEPRVVAGGDHDGKQSETSAVRQQVGSEDRSPQSESMPAGGRGDNDGQRRNGGIDRSEVSQKYSNPDPGVEVAVRSGPSQEVKQVHAAPSTPSIPPSGEPDST